MRARLTTQLVLTTGLIVLFVCVAVVSLWVRQVRSVLEEEARDQATSLAVALAASHYADVSQRNHAQIQLDFAVVAERSSDIAYVIATDAKDGDSIIAGVPRDVIGGVVPDVVPLEVTKMPAPRVTSTFLVRAIGSMEAGEPVIDAVENVKLRDGTHLGTVRLGVRYERLSATWRRAAKSALAIGIALVGLGMLLAALVARRIAAPVIALRDRLASVAEGKLDTHAVEEGAIEVRALGDAYNAMIIGLKQKRALERYVPMGARAAIEIRHSESGIVKPRRERAVVLFGDLRGFSSFAEKHTPNEVIDLVSALADRMSEVVVAEGGDVNEIMGDAILAVFSSPESAVRAAKRMLERLPSIGDGTLRMGIGLHLGDVVLGTIGTGDRVKFAVVGDTVNVAARIQERSKEAEKSAIYASEPVKRETGNAFEWIDRDEMPVRGREGSVHLFELA